MGLSNREIADRMCIDLHSVEGYVSILFAHYGCTSSRGVGRVKVTLAYLVGNGIDLSVLQTIRCPDVIERLVRVEKLCKEAREILQEMEKEDR
jgi:hypothetical protein